MELRGLRVRPQAICLVVAVSLAACGAPGTPAALPAERNATREAPPAGLGPVVRSQFGGEIFGWDIDQNGNDGVLTESVTEQNGSILNAIETFDQPSGKIVKVVRKTIRANGNVEPVTDAIAGNDVGIIDVERLVTIGGFYRDDRFDLMSPASKNRITGRSRFPRPKGVVPDFFTNNQASAAQVMLVLYFSKRTGVALYTYDTSTGQWGERFEFPKTHVFSSLSPIYAAVDATTNEAVVGYLARPAYNPQEPPSFDVRDATTGEHLRSFQGVGHGFPNGMAIDSSTGIMCTTTQGDMDVEFYHFATGKGKAVQIPVRYSHGGGLTSGAAVAADPVHHLFLVAQRNSTFSPSSQSTVIVYDERGKLVEYIDGFNFLDLFTVTTPHLAVNPANRTGYVDGPNPNELQEFSY